MLQRVTELLLAGGPEPENGLPDPIPPAQLIMEAEDGQRGPRAGHLTFR